MLHIEIMKATKPNTCANKNCVVIFHSMPKIDNSSNVTKYNFSILRLIFYNYVILCYYIEKN